MTRKELSVHVLSCHSAGYREATSPPLFACTFSIGHVGGSGNMSLVLEVCLCLEVCLRSVPLSQNGSPAPRRMQTSDTEEEEQQRHIFPEPPT